MWEEVRVGGYWFRCKGCGVRVAGTTPVEELVCDVCVHGYDVTEQHDEFGSDSSADTDADA